MELIEPEVKGQIVNRYEVESIYMDFPIEVVISKSTRRSAEAHIRTIPPGMSDTQYEYFRDVMLEERITRTVKQTPLWCTITVRSPDIEDAHDIADYAAEVYYDIFCHEA